MKCVMWCCFMLTALMLRMPVQAQINPLAGSADILPANAPFAEEINAFAASDKKSPSKPGGVLFIGSSSIRLWSTLVEDFPDLPVINRGFGGSQIIDSVRYADRIVFPYKPKMIVLYAGGNDINAGKSPTQVLKDFQAFVEKIHAVLPDTRIIFVSINPSVARWSEEDRELHANSMIERYIQNAASKMRKLSYIESHKGLLNGEGKPNPEILRADGLHLNASGYKAWTAILKPQIMARWKEDK